LVERLAFMLYKTKEIRNKDGDGKIPSD